MDVCEKMQLQALRIERFIDRTLTAREKAVQVPEEFSSSTHAERERERALHKLNQQNSHNGNHVSC